MLQIKRINYSTTIDMLVTGACKHAEHAKTPVVANQLYELAEDLNRIAATISRRGLVDILNSPLPNGHPPADVDDSEPDITPDTPAPAPVAAKPTPPPPPLPKHATLKQSVVDHVVHNPGSSAKQIAAALGIAYSSAANEAKLLKDHGHLRSEGSRPIRYFPA